MYAEDEYSYLIIEEVTGKIIWSEPKKNAQLGCEPCYVFCGRTDGKAAFYDICNQDYISEVNGTYVRHKKFSLVKPIIVNGQNILGVCENDNKLGVIAVGNRKTEVPEWDDIKIELKVTLRSGENEKEMTYPIEDFKAGDVIAVEEW